jgi:hypothetical protein
MTGQAIVIREHVENTHNACTYCGLPKHRWDQVECEPRLAALPAGWTGETVPVDDDTAAYLHRGKS